MNARKAAALSAEMREEIVKNRTLYDELRRDTYDDLGTDKSVLAAQQRTNALIGVMGGQIDTLIGVMEQQTVLLGSIHSMMVAQTERERLLGASEDNRDLLIGGGVSRIKEMSLVNDSSASPGTATSNAPVRTPDPSLPHLCARCRVVFARSIAGAGIDHKRCVFPRRQPVDRTIPPWTSIPPTTSS